MWIIEGMPLITVTGKILLTIVSVLSLFIGAEAKCKTPSHPEHGTMHLLGKGEVGSLALYSCDSGWKLVGDSASKCLSTGEWLSLPPKCVAGKESSTTTTAFRPTPTTAGSTLPKPSVVSPASTPGENEDSDENEILTPEQIPENICSWSYNSFNKKISVEISGSELWNGGKVRKGDKLILRCYDPAKPLVLPKATSISETLRLSCQVCRIGEDSDKSSCEEIVSGPEVLCPPIPDTDVLAVSFTNSRKINSTAYFRCKDSNSNIVGGLNTRICLPSGKWSGANPDCEGPEVLCPPIPDTEVLAVSFTNSRKINSTAYFRCKNSNSNIVGGLDTRICLPSGKWSGANPDCGGTDVLCPPIPDTEILAVNFTNSRKINSTAYFRCKDPNLNIVGGLDTRICRPCGEWSGVNPDCGEPCSIPFVQDGKIGKWVSSSFHRSLIFQEIPVGQRIADDERYFLHCSKGFNPLGDPINWQVMMTCKRGKWSSEPFCEMARCDSEPPMVGNGSIEKIDRKPGGTVSYVCRPNFNQVKSGNVSCSMGEWKGEPPTCTDHCIVPRNLNGHIEEQIEGEPKYNYWAHKWERKMTYKKIEVDSVPSGDGKMRLVCQDSHVIQGTDNLSKGIIRCSEGSWSYDLICIRKPS